MHGRRLATTEEIVALATPNSERALDRLESWASTNGVDLTVLDIAGDVRTPLLGSNAALHESLLEHLQ